MRFQHSESFETGISDYHHLIYSMLKTTYVKVPPKIIHYRSLRNFSLQNFSSDFIKYLETIKPSNLDDYCKMFESVLDAHAPKKKRTIRGNQKPFVKR